MDRDNARDTRAPSNRDVRLRRRTGLGGALVTGRALRRRSLNALFTRARHVHRPRQSSFASSSRPTHHPSPPLARIRGAGRDRAIDRFVPTPRRRHPARASTKTPRKTLKKIFTSPHPSVRVVTPRARRPSTAIVAHQNHHRATDPARAHFIHPTHSRAVAPVPAFERTRFGPAPLFTMVNAPRETRDEADVALVVIFVPTTAEVMVSPCIVGSRSASACAGAGVPGPGDARGHPRVVTRRCVQDVRAGVRA